MQNHRITPQPGNQSLCARLSAAITEAQAVIVAIAMLAIVASLGG